MLYKGEQADELYILLPSWIATVRSGKGRKGVKTPKLARCGTFYPACAYNGDMLLGSGRNSSIKGWWAGSPERFKISLHMDVNHIYYSVTVLAMQA